MMTRQRDAKRKVERKETRRRMWKGFDEQFGQHAWISQNSTLENSARHLLISTSPNIVLRSELGALTTLDSTSFLSHCNAPTDARLRRLSHTAAQRDESWNFLTTRRACQMWISQSGFCSAKQKRVCASVEILFNNG